MGVGRDVVTATFILFPFVPSEVEAACAGLSLRFMKCLDFGASR